MFHRPKRNRIPLRLPPREVTRYDPHTEVDPAAVGVEPAAVELIWEEVERLYEAGLHPAISLCIRRRGEVVLNRAIGHTCGNSPMDSAGSPKVPVKPETPFCIFSASKAITAIVIHMLDERGFLHVGDRVADYIPEFGQHGKEWVTIRHVLTHRAGIPSVPSDYAVLELLKDWDRIVELLCDAPLVSAPGRRLAYHAVTGGFILGEIVRRVTGGTIRQFL
ncbi:MAG: beta-lactamase family protein, partial [Deltaproteobacteria bacterium]|nr:beta-lactamase family protein [Deltaproteobacteria bacterium]